MQLSPRIRLPIVAWLRDSRGNVLPMIAAAVFPLLAMLGGAIDMGRSYLAESRLQQACDSGVLAARKRMGTLPAATGVLPPDVAAIGNRFFNVNFRDGQYGTQDRRFGLILESDYALSGEASVNVPTTVMRLFGKEQVELAVTCGSQLGMSNTDVMMVLDVTGSMNETNSGDAASKITLMRATIGQFYDQIKSNQTAGTRVRYGFVPYSTNVNVGALLDDAWVVKDWTYQSRTISGSGASAGIVSFWSSGSTISGNIDSQDGDKFAATNSGGVYSCPAAPAGSVTSTSVFKGSTSSVYVGPPAGTIKRDTYWYTYNGDTYSNVLTGTSCQPRKVTRTNYVVSYDYVTQPALKSSGLWTYGPVTSDVTAWRSETAGCMEERATYPISDYSAVDLDRALDLDIDRVPTAGDSATQWRPMYPARVYARSLKWNNGGSFTLPAITTADEYFSPAVGGTAACPPAAKKLTELTRTQLDAYLTTLVAAGSTYHDIGMIWGGRLLSPTGLFAAQNADVSANQPTNRNLIMMTDGQTSTLDLSYSAYGLEPIDRRRWAPGGADTLTQVVEDRFAYACQEVKKKNVTVWFIAFGTALNPIMTDCAGPGHAFAASNGAELADAFKQIAGGISNLRLTH